uniref:Uncharacterized protein n=1 Tax=Nicotiana tabacum TaxID=4097 RepID=A0A1S3X5T6_TOBAC|nr:PREDICTED: uncharacterized protein LOC107761361 [Nicotiana tabacum]XP_016435073.1 PREDICTED: uncharacterized protein LOC107761361 [Nicotiana tabacum]
MASLCLQPQAAMATHTQLQRQPSPNRPNKLHFIAFGAPSSPSMPRRFHHASSSRPAIDATVHTAVPVSSLHLLRPMNNSPATFSSCSSTLVAMAAVATASPLRRPRLSPLLPSTSSCCHGRPAAPVPSTSTAACVQL